MPRYRLVVEYDGTGIVGWQRQANGPSVQGALEEACAALVGEAVTVHGAGRTDVGVHALGQVAHVDLAREFAPETVRAALNFHLKPARIAVVASELAPQDFHARFSARERVYLYRILNRRSPPALLHNRVWFVPQRLDAGAMREAAKALVGKHDFSSFRAAICQSASPVKTLDELDVTRDGDEVRITARGRSFLHHQVRNIAGTLKLVGEGKWQPRDVARALEARDRAAAGPTAPAAGLYLVEVRY